MNYGGNLHNTPENLMMLANAEWLNVIGDKVCQQRSPDFRSSILHRIPHKLSTADALLSLRRGVPAAFYGHINLINL